MNNEPRRETEGRKAVAGSRKWGFVALCAGEDRTPAGRRSPCASTSDSFPSSSNGSAEMAAVYYERIDVEGHHYGPSSQQRKNALKEVDKALSNMISLIKVSGIRKTQLLGAFGKGL
ncbi:hypothetical protein llap_20426 [Limosa lapponica baueri]|uniref:Uncharacterized protein n=1 Tax=Limosa lapponica baueri TaxID=1758121 RepID=A0A2I0T660_LIMLA|nr:hypothetical protein llap_20426 [Limosa lapponica baueri]